MNFKIYIGTMFRDLDGNVYQVKDIQNGNSHSQYPSSYLCECLEGHNAGKVRWVSRSTILSIELEEV